MKAVVTGIASLMIGGSCVLNADSVSVVWSAQVEGAAIATSDAVELVPGMVVRLGVFDLSEAAVEASKSDVAYLDEHFTEISREVIGTFGGSIVLAQGGTSVAEQGTNWGVSGAFAQKVSFNAATWGGGLEGKRFYIWAVDSGSLDQPPPTEQAIFSDSSWVLPPGAQATYSWDISSVEREHEGDVYLATAGQPSEVSPTLGGLVNKMQTIAAIDLFGDEDGDGVVRMLEEALGGDPTTVDLDGILPEQVEVSIDGATRMALRYRRLEGGSGTTGYDYESGGFRYWIQMSTDLHEWIDLEPEAYVVLGITANGDGTETVTAAYNGAEKAVFLRLGVRRLP